jgi:hypothetical protein
MKINLFYLPFVLLAFTSFSLEAFYLKLSEDQIEVYESLPREDQPILPLDRNFTWGAHQSTQFTPRSLEMLDKKFLIQTGGGIQRAIGTAEMLTLVRKILEDRGARLSTDEMEFYAMHQIFSYLHHIGSPRADRFLDIMATCHQTGEKCNEAITFDELAEFIEQEKAKIFHLISAPAAAPAS